MMESRGVILTIVANRVIALTLLQRDDLLFGSRFETGRLFEDIEQRASAIDPITFRIAHPFENAGAFKPLDGALRCRECDSQFVHHSSCSNEGICPQEFDYTQWIVACFSGHFLLPLIEQSVDAHGSTQSILRHASHSKQEILQPVVPCSSFADPTQTVVVVSP